MAADTTKTPSEATPTPSGSGAGSEPADPKAELNRLKDLVQKNKDQIDQISQASSSYQQDIAVLESGLKEITQVVNAFTQGTQSIKDLSSLKTFVDQKSNIAVAALGANGKAAVDAIVAKYDADVAAQSKSVDDLQAASAQAVSAQQAALQDANAKQAAYNTAKGILSRVQASHTDLQNLQKQVGSATDAGNIGAMYFLLGEMRSGLNALEIPSAADLQNQLSGALLDLKAALKTAREKKAASDQAQAAVVNAQKKLDNAKTGRRASLMEAVRSVKPQPAQPSSPPAAQPTTAAAAQPTPPRVTQPAPAPAATPATQSEPPPA